MLLTLLQCRIVIFMQIKLNVVVVVVVVGLSNGGRSFTKNMDQKNAFRLGISNSNVNAGFSQLRSRETRLPYRALFFFRDTGN